MSLDVLAIMAHPDDAELLCGGTLLKSADAGERTGVVDLTAGEMGSAGTPELRAQEAARSAEILGLGVRRCAGLPDSRLENDEATRRTVVSLIREFRPRVVITHWKVGRHRDHRLCAEIVRDACFLTGLKKFEAEGAPFRPEKLVYATAFREDAGPPSFVVDVTAQMERRRSAMQAFHSQFDGAVQAGEVFPGGDRPLPEQVDAHLAHYGSLIRAAYGEPFRVDEMLEVDTLGQLGVSAF